MARWRLEFDAIDPNDCRLRWKTGILQKHYDRLARSGHEKAVARIILVNEVLCDSTLEIYRGWSRPGKDDTCFVYLGAPKRDFKSLTIETPAPQDMAFLVFVLPDGTIDEWTWRPTTDGKPDGVNGELIWQANRS